MIDLHTHILPGIDDGAASSSVSFRQMEILLSQGVDTVVLTSHYYGRKRSPEQYLEARNEAFEKIKEGIPAGMKTVLGAEVHFTKQTAASNESLASLSIGDTRYILTELPFNSDWDKGLWNRLEDFISDTDRVPVIAHVERYEEARKKPACVSMFKDMGCLLQVNTSSFTDSETRNFVFALLKHGLIDCLGTDTHNTEDRAPDYAAAKAVIEGAGCEENFARIQETMRLVLDDRQVPRREFKPVKKFLGKYY